MQKERIITCTPNKTLKTCKDATDFTELCEVCLQEFNNWVDTQAERHAEMHSEPPCYDEFNSETGEFRTVRETDSQVIGICEYCNRAVTDCDPEVVYNRHAAIISCKYCTGSNDIFANAYTGKTEYQNQHDAAQYRILRQTLAKILFDDSETAEAKVNYAAGAIFGGHKGCENVRKLLKEKADAETEK